MSYQLTFGGGEAILIRDKGTANAVQGFVAREIVVSKNITALATNFVFQLIEYVQFVIASAPVSTIVWLKVAGVWKQATAFLKVTGNWKTTTPYIKVSGNWK